MSPSAPLSRILWNESALKQSQMVRIPSLQRAHQQVKFGKPAQILQPRVFHKKRPARESGADAALQPFKSICGPLQQRENASNQIISMVRMPERFRTGASAVQTFQGPFRFAAQSAENAEKTDGERFVG